ncbi:ZAR1-like protein [Asterias rubens]|uniref:ZAR1-like protein n=1 Tax=Asterias rubens TaxID=7604 RepID=UPI001455D275|nr:ZAR1-like protein [Asterias rubens]
MSAKRCVLNLSGKLFAIYQRRPIAHGTPSFAKKKNPRRHKPRTVTMPGSDQRRYGFFTCPTCKRGWESSWAWCYKGTDIPSSGQECKTCLVMVKPHTVEKLKCSLCDQPTNLCDCEQDDLDEHHSDLNKPHRSDLCEKCKRGQRCGYRR